MFQSELPQISVITVCFNSGKTIKETIESVIQQNYKDYEYLIIDGGSTDDTIEIIQLYSDKISYWSSEPDKGISDAFNKGISKAKGSIIALLNADDTYVPGALEYVAQVFREKPDIQILNCSTKICSSDLKTVLRVFHPDLNGLNVEMTVPHPSMFIKKTAYELVGEYRTDLRYAMDYEYTLRLRSKSLIFSCNNFVTTNHRFGGIANRYIRNALKEVRAIKLEYKLNGIGNNFWYAKRWAKSLIGDLLRFSGLKAS